MAKLWSSVQPPALGIDAPRESGMTDDPLVPWSPQAEKNAKPREPAANQEGLEICGA
jgi:hypothetical protein